MVSALGEIFLILLYCSQTLPRGVWCKTFVYWAPPMCTIPARIPFQLGEEQGSPAQCWLKAEVWVTPQLHIWSLQHQSGFRAPLLLYCLQQETLSHASLAVLILLSLCISPSAQCFLKKHLHGQRDLKYLLSAVITTDQEMRIIHLLETYSSKHAWQHLAPFRFLGQQQGLEDTHLLHNAEASIVLPLPGTQTPTGPKIYLFL